MKSKLKPLIITIYIFRSVSLIYLAPLSATSSGYARGHVGWSNSVNFKTTNNMRCLCLCEGMYPLSLSFVHSFIRSFVHFLYLFVCCSSLISSPFFCSVIENGYKPKPHYVIPEEDHVMTRYFFIYDDATTTPSVEANKLKNVRSSPLAT